ncbi:MAG: cytochrome c [Actinobacteria bacterium]|nr:cytochrome c [Actinomycetota bacterium]
MRTRKTLYVGFAAAALLGGLLVAAACGSESGTSADVALGETIYVEGTDAQGAQITHTTEAGILSQAGCYACHGTDGKGRSIDTKLGQFDAPDIRWSVIGQPMQTNGVTEPPYDATTFARALRDGVGSDGDQLEPVMPRWQLTDAEVNALIAYLKTL